MTYKIDSWSGDCHQSHCETFTTSNWAEACDFMLQRVEAGLLCNVLHTDFIAPTSKIKEARQQLFAEHVNSEH